MKVYVVYGIIHSSGYLVGVYDLRDLADTAADEWVKKKTISGFYLKSDVSARVYEAEMNK